MPPSNTSFLTATLVTSGVTQIVDLTGLAYPSTTYYKYLLRENESMISAWARPSTIIGANTGFYFDIYLGPASAPVDYDDIGQTSDEDRPKMIPMTSTYPTMTPLPEGTEVFFEVKATINIVSNRSLKFTVEGTTQSTIPAGSVIVSSDGEPFPLIGLGWDGEIKGFVHNPNGEGGTMLANGISAHTNKTNGHLDVFDASHALINSLTLTPSVGGNSSYVSSNRTSTFYVNYPGISPFTTVPGIVYVVNSAGTLTNTITFAGYGIFQHAPNWGNTILYVIAFAPSTGVIKRWDLVSGAFLSDLYTIPTGYIAKLDLVVVESGIIVIPIRQTTSPYTEVLALFNPDGSSAGSISVGSGTISVGNFLVNRTCNGFQNNSVIVWFKDSSVISKFIEYEIPSGTILNGPVEFDQFDVDGDSDTSVTHDAMDMFGPQNSCPVMCAMVDMTTIGEPEPEPEPEPDPSGIFSVNPNKSAKHDSYYGSVERKIPNPTIRTSLLGE